MGGLPSVDPWRASTASHVQWIVPTFVMTNVPPMISAAPPVESASHEIDICPAARSVVEA